MNLEQFQEYRSQVVGEMKAITEDMIVIHTSVFETFVHRVMDGIEEMLSNKPFSVTESELKRHSFGRKSKTVEELTYNTRKRELTILFRDGKLVECHGVSKSAYEGLTEAGSPDNWCLNNIDRFSPKTLRVGRSYDYIEEDKEERNGDGLDKRYKRW